MSILFKKGVYRGRGSAERRKEERIMKQREYKRRLFSLQLFAEGDGEGEGSSGTGGAAAGSGDGEGNAGQREDSVGFDDFLNDPKNKAEFERRIEEALSAQKEKLAGEYQTSLEDAKKEAEKLAKMNAEQKKQYEEEKKDQLIEEQKKEIDRLKNDAMKAELSKEAARIMKADHSIIATQDMLDFVVGSSADSTKANITKLVGIILDDRKAQEQKRATGRTPKSYSNNGNTLSEIDKRLAKYQ